MTENLKVMIKLEYVRDGLRRAVYGEADKNKVKEFRTGEEGFMLLMNDGKPKWVDKQAILSVSELEEKSCLYEKEETEDASFGIRKPIKISS